MSYVKVETSDFGSVVITQHDKQPRATQWTGDRPEPCSPSKLNHRRGQVTVRMPVAGMVHFQEEKEPPRLAATVRQQQVATFPLKLQQLTVFRPDHMPLRSLMRRGGMLQFGSDADRHAVDGDFQRRFVQRLLQSGAGDSFP